MKVIIVGGCGLLGANTALRMREHGHDVTLAGRNPPPAGSPIEDFRFEQFDYLSDGGRAERMLRGYDALLFAAGSEPRQVPADPEGPMAWMRRETVSGQFLYRSNNIDLPAVFVAAREAGVKSAIHIGTYYPQVVPEALATNNYMLARREAADAVTALDAPGFRTMSVNPSWVMGMVPGMGFARWAVYLRHAEHTDPADAFAPPGGTNVMTIDMLSDAVIGAFARGIGGTSYLLGGQNATYQAMLGAFFEGFGKPIPPVRSDPHPILVDRSVPPGKPSWYETDPDETALLGYGQEDALAMIRDVMVPAYRRERAAALA